VAYHCHKQGIQATVVMPTTAPQNKIEYCESKGARVLFHGAHLAEAFPKAEELADEQGLVMIHPYDDYHVMAGQGTLGLELVEDMHKPLDTVIIPVGGGGLSAGMGTALKHHWPYCTIYGVQTEFAPNMAVDLFGYVPEVCEVESSIAEGIAVKRPGRLTKPILKSIMRDIFVVKESMIARAMHDLLIHEKQVVEGAGAAGVAAVLTSPDIFHGKRVGIVLCGGNVDAEIVGQVAV
jgi:threonine dehydratase